MVKIISYSQYSDERRRTSITAGILKPFYEQGLDAVIVQDLGAVSVIRKHFPT